MRINKKNKKKIIIASVLGGLATIFIFSSMSSKNADMEKMNKMLAEQQAAMEKMKQNPFPENAANTKVSVVIAGQDIKVGDTLTVEMLKLKECMEEDAPEGYFKTAALVVGKKAGKNLVRGQYVTTAELQPDDVATVEIPNDMRAISIPVDKFKGLASHIRIGSTVDILKVANPPEYIAQNLRVVAFETNGAAAASRYNANGATKPAAGSAHQTAVLATAITFLVPLDIVPKLLDSMFAGELQVIARNSSDQKVVIPEKELPPPPSGGLALKLPEINLPTEPAKSETKTETIAPPVMPKPEPKKVEFIKASAVSSIEFNDDDSGSSNNKPAAAASSSPGDLSKLNDLMKLVK